MGYFHKNQAQLELARPAIILYNLLRLYSLKSIFLSAYTHSMNTTTLSALAEPNRLRIVELLRDQPHSVGEIAIQLSIRQPQVSKHLRVLTEAGLVEVHPLAQQHIYQLQAKPFRELDIWLNSFRQIWETRLDTFADYMQQLKAEQAPKKE
jgi:DNA-binding transcriptional ArsR family regulator